MSDLKEIPGLPLVAVLAGLLNYQNSRGKLKLKEVTTTNTDYFGAGQPELTIEETLRSLIDLDGDSDPAIRVGFHTVTGSTKFSKRELTEEQVFRNMIGKTSDGKPYLRVVLDEL